MRFSDVTVGYAFPHVSLALDAETVRRYLTATGDDNALYWQGDASPGEVRIVPPLAVAALAFQGIARGVALSPGSLHTGQELSFRRLVTVGERLTAQATVAAASQRRGFTVMAIDTATVDDGGEVALSGRMSLMVAPHEGQIIAGGTTPALEDALATLPPLTPVAYAPLSAIAPGVEIPPLARTVTQEQINAYALASGDRNPIHIDPAFAATTPFGTTVAHGMLLLALISAALTRAFGQDWIDTGSLKVRFRNPAPAGTTVTAGGRVERVEGGDGVQYAVCAVHLENEAGESLITGEARVDVRKVS